MNAVGEKKNRKSYVDCNGGKSFFFLFHCRFRFTLKRNENGISGGRQNACAVNACDAETRTLRANKTGV